MRSRSELIQSKAFTCDLTPYMDQARGMYPGGRFQRVIRAFDRVFHYGLVEFTDMHNAMILADREQRAEMFPEQASTEHTGPNPFEPDLTDVLPSGVITGWD